MNKHEKQALANYTVLLIWQTKYEYIIIIIICYFLFYTAPHPTATQVHYNST